MIAFFVLNALWQGFAVVLVASVAARLCAKENAATRYALWFAALWAIVLVPLLAAALAPAMQVLAWASHGSGAGHGTFSLVTAGTLSTQAAAPLSWLARFCGAAPSLWLAIVWIGGSALALGRLALSYARIASLRRGAVLWSRIDGVEVSIADDLTVPIATGIRSPVVLLPRALAEHAGAADLRYTIEHELAHVRRGDVLGNAIARLAEAFMFWNPWVHVAGRNLIREREAACDDRAVRRTGRPREYAASLAAIARRVKASRTYLLTPGAIGSRNALVARIERLMDDGTPRDSKLNYFTLGVAVMIFAALTLAFGALAPAPVPAAGVLPPVQYGAAVAAASCQNPNAGVTAINPAAPDLPHAQMPAHPVSAIVAVTVAANGKATAARVYKSSGNANLDRAVLTAAEKSTYAPKRVNCTAVTGTYLFKADFAP